MRGTEQNLLIFISLTSTLAAAGPAPIEDEDDNLLLPGSSCEESPPCPDGKICEMIEPPCYTRAVSQSTLTDPKMFKWIIIGLLVVLTAADDDTEYIHLPGKTCEDAPPCPDGTPCVMAPPMCNKGTCGTDPVPSCRA
ncbi:unnamed protein product [Arctia plantaginis]|uniref:Uncharacterized protein n=1 Tax=Arctia plantaginis TaxID=874455 RepID=A0A8S1A6G2_ARCPL|nr:unnamed protein product [Arctia plantaginis]